MPVTPFAAHGKRIDPPVSEPVVAKARAAAATPDPLEEAPDQCSGCQGFTGTATSGW